MSPEGNRRRAARPAAADAVPLVLLVLLAGPGCGLKGDPLPPLRQAAPAPEEAPAETEAASEENEDPEPEAEDSDGEEDGDDAQGAA